MKHCISRLMYFHSAYLKSNYETPTLINPQKIVQYTSIHMCPRLHLVQAHSMHTVWRHSLYAVNENHRNLLMW